MGNRKDLLTLTLIQQVDSTVTAEPGHPNVDVVREVLRLSHLDSCQAIVDPPRYALDEGIVVKPSAIDVGGSCVGGLSGVRFNFYLFRVLERLRYQKSSHLLP
jgi:hypothetical protein